MHNIPRHVYTYMYVCIQVDRVWERENVSTEQPEVPRELVGGEWKEVGGYMYVARNRGRGNWPYPSCMQTGVVVERRHNRSNQQVRGPVVASNTPQQ